MSYTARPIKASHILFLDLIHRMRHNQGPVVMSSAVGTLRRPSGEPLERRLHDERTFVPGRERVIDESREIWNSESKSCGVVL